MLSGTMLNQSSGAAHNLLEEFPGCGFNNGRPAFVIPFGLAVPADFLFFFHSIHKMPPHEQSRHGP